jgi:predicted transcriptional regulator YdeE
MIDMGKETMKEINLIGLALKTKTTNAHGQSSIDCKELWHKFENGKHATSISNKLSGEIYGVYYNYDGDSTKPFSYFIGCKVKKGTATPEGLDSLTIAAGQYEKITVTGKMPDIVINAWKEIWKADYARTYQTDFEIYDERTKDWGNAEVDVYLSVEE